jgi:hypothetical protein
VPSHSPGTDKLTSFRREFGWIALIDVITFKTDFRPSGFDRPVTEFYKNQIISKLAGAGIVRLTVLLKRGPVRELVLHFDGAPEDVAKANEAFGLDFSHRPEWTREVALTEPNAQGESSARTKSFRHYSQVGKPGVEV